jgi:hypothetical protein
VLPDGTFSVPFPREAVRIGSGPDILLGDNRLNASGLSLNLAGGGRSIRGSLAFGPLLHPRYDIMGPFKYVPAMECRHHLVSLAHEVRGTLEVDGQLQTYDGAMGYIDGDSGRSFPRVTCGALFSAAGGPKSIMLSVAEIPWIGLRFTGVVGFILTDRREERHRPTWREGVGGRKRLHHHPAGQQHAFGRFDRRRHDVASGAGRRQHVPRHRGKP